MTPSPFNCGSLSIQYQIIRYAMHHGEVRKLKDEAYREKIRLALRAKYPERKWCDHREGEHACITEPGPTVAIRDMVDNVFGTN